MPYDQDIAFMSLPMLQKSGISYLEFLYVSDVKIVRLGREGCCEEENGNVGNLHGGRLVL